MQGWELGDLDFTPGPENYLSDRVLAGGLRGLLQL